ncbi:MAG: hypothetical protein ACI3Y5_04755 [Prevotella sp.]
MRHIILLADCRERYGLTLSDDTLVAEAYSYYEQQGRKRERMMARFIAGCVCRDRGDIDAAAYHYGVALSLTGNKDKEPERTMAMRIRLSLARLSILQGDIQESINEARSIITVARRNKAGRYVHEGMAALAEAYMAGGKMGEAENVCHRLHNSMVRGILDCYAVRNVCPRLADMLVRLGDYDKAGRILDIVSLYAKAYVPLSSGENHDRVDMRHLYARYYEGIGKSDSARLYYMAMLGTKDSGQRIVAYRHLAKLAADGGDNDGSMRWSAELKSVEDSITRCVGHSLRASRRHDGLSLSSIIREKETERKTLALCLAVVVLLFVVNVIVWRATMRKKRKRIMALQNQMYHDTLDRLRQARHDYETLRDDARKLAREKEMEISSLQMQLSSFMEKTGKDEIDNTVRDFYTSDFIVGLHKLAARGKTISPDDVSRLRTLIETEMPSFACAYKARGDLLSPNEDAICLLTRMRFLPTEIAVMLDMTPQRVTNLRASINRKMFYADGARTFDRNIMGME